MSNLVKLKIGEFVLDRSRNLLSSADGDIALEPKVVDVLMVLATRPGEVQTRDELIEAVWKTEFGADERVTRAVSLLRKAFGDERGTARYIETIPKRGYRLVAAVAPLAEGEAAVSPLLQQQAPSAPISVPTHSHAPARTWPRYLATTGIAAALGLAALALMLWPWRSSDLPGRDVVDLEPLAVIGTSGNGGVFALQVESSLRRILATNGVLLLDGKAQKARVAREFTLTGSVEQIGEQYAVNLYLNNERDGQTLWSHRFARPIADTENLRDEVGVNAAFTIGCALKERRAAHEKPSRETFKIYLESCDPTEDWGSRLAIAQRLTKIAPRDAYGHGLEALAHAFFVLDDLELSKPELEAHQTAARRAIARARELDDGHTLARTAELVLAAPLERWRSGDDLQRASVEHPSALGIYFHMLRSSGRLRDALHVAERALAVRQLSPLSRANLAIIQMQQGEPQVADRLFEEALRLWPDDENLRFYQLVNAAFYGDPERALKLLDRFKDRWRQVCYRTFIEARQRGGSAGDRAAVREACVALAGDSSGMDYAARMLAVLGDVDGVYEVLGDKSFHWNGATTLLFYPEMAAFRKDARFMPFIAKSGLLEAWSETGHWPDFCRDPMLPYECKSEAARVLRNEKERATLNATR